MKVVVIGGGGREHAIIKKLKNSSNPCEIIALPGNGGILSDARCVSISAEDLDSVVEFCVAEKADYVVVAPDNPLAMGMVDELEKLGIPAFGPSKAAAKIESSKVFAKSLMKKYGIPTAGYEVFSDADTAFGYIKNCGKFPVVIKADGLALGKGVYICEDAKQAETAIAEIMQQKIFGESGSNIVIEEFLTGPEISVLAFCDGKTIAPMVSSMDHKRAYDNDEGPNTGGMGVVAPNPYYTKEVEQLCMDKIFKPTVKAMEREGAVFKGCLYFGLMLCGDGPKVIEYNCRFGDPETQAVLPLTSCDLLQVMQSCTNGTLEKDMVTTKAGASACVIIASGGYPAAYKKGCQISGLEEAQAMEGISVFHAGTSMEHGKTYSSGGRVLGVAAIGRDLKQAVDKAYEASGKISFENSFCRKDIGKKAIEAMYEI